MRSNGDENNLGMFLSRVPKLTVSIYNYFCRGMSSDEATKDVIEKQIPEVVRQNKSGALNVENIDVFCEKGVFNVEQTKSILQVGKDLGNLRINFHGEELNYLGSVEVRYPNIFISTIVFT